MGEFFYLSVIIVIAIFLIWKIPFFHRFQLPWWWFVIAFMLKILAGGALIYIYTYYYSDRAKADIYKYFDDGKIMYEAIHQNPSHYFRMLTGIDNDNPLFDSLYYSRMNNWYRVYETVTYNDSHTMIRLNAIFFLFSGGYFTVHSLFFILMSFVGCVLLYAAVVKFFPQKDKLLFLAVFAIPSVVFWSSGALKESVLMLGMGLNVFSLHFFLEEHRKKWVFILLFLLSLFILIFIKMYVLVAIIPMILAYVWVSLTKGKRAFLKYTLTISSYILLLYLAGKIDQDYFFPSLIVQKQHDFIGLALHEKSESFIQPLPIKPGLFSLVVYAFPALINAMFQPFIWTASSMLEMISSLELILIYMTMVVLFFHGKIEYNCHIWFFIYFALLMFLLVGYTTPVAGAIARYRVPAILFLMIGLLGSLKFEQPLKKK